MHEFRTGRPAAGRWTLDERDGYASATILLALFGVLVIGANVDLFMGMSVGTALAAALFPLWWRSLAAYSFAPVIAVLAAGCIGSSVLLTAWMAATHDTSLAWTSAAIFALVGLVVCLGWLLWARDLVPMWLVATVYAVGMFTAIRPSDGVFASDPWRFGFSVPTTVLVFALVSRRGRRPVEIGAALVLASASALSGARSSSAILLMVVALAVWQARRPIARTWLSVVRTGAFLAGLGAVAYYGVQQAILEGLLGEAARERTQLQLAYDGSLITGGRPEIGAFGALLRAFPLGFGGGVAPSASDVAVAKSGMADLNYDPNNGYVERFMFGNGFELHSVAGDLWVRYGLAGLALAALLAIIVTVRLVQLIAERRASALMIFLTLKSLWNVFFSPIGSATPILVLTLAILLARRTAIAEGDVLGNSEVGDTRSRPDLGRTA